MLNQRDLFGEQFRTMAEAMPALLWGARGDGTVDYYNGRWTEYTGFELDQFFARASEVRVVHPDDRDDTIEKWSNALRLGEPFEQKYRLRRGSDGSYRWFLARAVPIRDEDGAVVRWIGTATDIDEQERARDSLSFIVGAGNVLSLSLDVETIAKSLARVAVGYFADWCFVALVEGSSVRTAAMDHRDQELVRYLERHRDLYPPRPGDALLTAIEGNEALLFERVPPEQVEAAARDAEHLRLLRLLQMHSVMIVPIATPEGKVLGALSMVSAESGRLFSRTDLNVAREVANRAAIAIANARMYEAERRAADRLRLVNEANRRLFESLDPWKAMERIAGMLAESVADACIVVRSRDGIVRVESAAHRDAGSQSVIAALLGQRLFRADAEREFLARLAREPAIAYDGNAQALREYAWPYLVRVLESAHLGSAVAVPIGTGSSVYGALIACYAEPLDDPNRDVPLLTEIASRAALAIGRAETFERERKIASTLQQASLPSQLPETPGLRFDAVYRPAGEEADVGGDWYDAIELDDGSVVVSVGDVTGRGIQAAAVMSKVRHAMGVAPLHESDPAKILDAAGWFLAKKYPDAIVTAFVAIVSADRRTIRFANAGHPWPILRRGDRHIELKARGLPLGLRNFSTPEPSEQFDLHDGDFIVLFTDGLTEAERDTERAMRCLNEMLAGEAVRVSVAPATLIAKGCLPASAHDDVAILTVAIGNAPVWTFAAEDARAAVDARSLFVEFLAKLDGDREFLARAELVFGELLGNAVRHAPGPVEISLYAGDRVVLHVIDSGPPFEVRDRQLPQDVLSELGRGLYIVTQLVREIRVEHVANVGNHVRVRL
jgi:PAS domain S-box-containing protein